MIFITVGTEQYPFDRLLHWVARAIDRTGTREQVIVQSGACTFEIPGAVTHTTLRHREFDEIACAARVIISHCGEGSFFNLRATGVPFLLVPRRFGLGEHIDDHQWELANVLNKIGAYVGWIPTDVHFFIQGHPQPRHIQLSSQSLVDHLINVYEPAEAGCLSKVADQTPCIH
ncbi:MAG: glucosyl transferase [Gemmatimonadaceae bacterium]|nr:glucosyl transferase [Gloeobacterales cyanobacterium ES-bin-141]